MLDKERGLYIAHCSEGALSITGKMANRHGLIAGATGTGKTVTLQVMAETFCQAGVPCFMADMKGDLSGISQVGKMSGFIEKRLPEFGIENPEFQACPVRFADERGLLILDLKDLRMTLDWVSKHAKEYTTKYGNISAQTIGAIQRALLQLENQGANHFFGEPSFDIYDLLQTEGGKGVMSVLAADKLMMQPKLYSTFLLWLLSELYSTLPEVGDLPLPKLVFFFDEAHMLFTDTSKALLDKIEQVIRLIRSKGVGIYFITQSPTDIPENILGQLGNRVQHALRAYTPKDQKAVKTAADTFRPNPAFKTDEAIMNLETGEALVSFLDEKGAPNIVQRAKVLFPLSQIGAVTEGQRLDIIKQSRVYGKYDTPIDRESAYELLTKEAPLSPPEGGTQEPSARKTKEAPSVAVGGAKKPGMMSKVWKAVLTAVTSTLATILGTWVSNKVSGKQSKSKTSAKEKVVKNATSAATRTITKELTRDILGNLVK